jgi:hypothetical protein
MPTAGYQHPPCGPSYSSKAEVHLDAEIAMKSTRAQLLPPAGGGSRHLILGAKGAPLLVVG